MSSTTTALDDRPPPQLLPPVHLVARNSLLTGSTTAEQELRLARRNKGRLVLVFIDINAEGRSGRPGLTGP
jgi:hypothetical protein